MAIDLRLACIADGANGCSLWAGRSCWLTGPCFLMWSVDFNGMHYFVGEISLKLSGCNHTAINWRQLTGGIVALKIPLVAFVYMSEKSGIQTFGQWFHNGTSWLLPSQDNDCPWILLLIPRQYPGQDRHATVDGYSCL